MLLRIFIVKLLILLSLASNAQELNAEVQVLSPAIQRTNKQVFNTLETAIRQFLNTRKWTSEKYAQEEKINCSFIINMTKWDGNDNFEGTLQIQYSRPIYKSTNLLFLFIWTKISNLTTWNLIDWTFLKTHPLVI